MKAASVARMPLEEVQITDQLPLRERLSTSEDKLDKAIMHLIRLLSQSPKDVLQHLAEAALDLCSAGTVGISVLEYEEDADVFRWRAMSGKLAGSLGLSMARNDSPCGMVLDRRDTMLFTYPEKHFPFPAPVEPSIVEVLLVPFFDQGEPVGTIWVVSHDNEKKFTIEDARIVRELCRVTSAAYFQLRELGYVKDLRVDRRMRQLPQISRLALAEKTSAPPQISKPRRGGNTYGPPTSTVHVQLSGTYKRTRGRQQTYTYRGSFAVNSVGTWWTIAVHCGEVLKGTPLGTLEGVPNATKSQVTAQIERQIEELDQLTE